MLAQIDLKRQAHGGLVVDQEQDPRICSREIGDAELVAVAQNMRVAWLQAALVDADAVAALPVLQNILSTLAYDARVFARRPVGAQIDRVRIDCIRLGPAEAG